ncbi:MAG TPA: competence protein [Candidatus Hydrogenedentes bacterium]|nr:competence protein [Candidatus Hydrogenedentota bacterium]
MSKTVFIDDDLVKVQLPEKRVVVLAWGDPIKIVSQTSKNTIVELTDREGNAVQGTVKGKLKTTDQNKVLKFAMVDVQQGDALILESPSGKLMFIDAGDNQMFARYAAARFSGTSKSKPLSVEAIVVTHGDTDHFEGFNKAHASIREKDKRKRIYLQPKNVFHNGIVKGPAEVKNKKVPVEKIFGCTVKKDNETYLVDLVDDLRNTKVAMNTPFKRWSQTLIDWTVDKKPAVQRLAFGNKKAFKFLAKEGINVEVLGPITKRIKKGKKMVEALPLLHQPPKFLDDNNGTGTALSASHTINGHSVVLRLTYQNVRFLLGGDMNAESMARLSEKVKPSGLQCEILKVPHHGSSDFNLNALKQIAPVVSLISSGDESSRKEYIHPRAELVGALGKASRTDKPLILCTELSAFFRWRDLSQPIKDKNKTPYYGFERTAYGIVHVRTDGERILVFTHSGKDDLKEAYRFRVDKKHNVKCEPVEKR